MRIRYNTIGPDGLWGMLKELKIDTEQIVSRECLKNIVERLDKNAVEVLCGPRQSGKTTLLYLLMIEITKKNLSPEYIHYLNLDTLPGYAIFENPVRFCQAIRESHQNNKEQKVYLLLDEIQRLKNPGLFLKAIYDSCPEIKLIVSGSSSLEIRAKTKEFLTGRKYETLLLPLSYREIVRYSKKLPPDFFEEKVTADNIELWKERQQIYGQFLVEQMMEMTIHGGYPGVFMAENKKNKEEILYELYNSYVKKDITDFLKVENLSLFNNLARTFAAQIAGLINLSQICSLLGGNRITISKYLNILEETYVIKTLTPFVRNKRNEVKYARKCFFYDCGLRNLPLNQFGEVLERSDFGSLLENMVAGESIKSLGPFNNLYYWRTKAGAEVDFVIESAQGIIPVEVKFLSAKIGTLSRSFHSFLETYHPPKAFFLNRDQVGCLKKESTAIFYLPIHWFLLGCAI